MSNIIRNMSDVENDHFFEYIQSFEEYKSLLGLVRKSFVSSHIVLKSDYNREPIKDFQYSTEFPVVYGDTRLTQSILLYGAMLLSDTDLVVISSLERRPDDPVPPIPGLSRLNVFPYGVFDIIDPTLMMPHRIIGLGSNSPTIFMLFRSNVAVEPSNFAVLFEKNCLYCIINVFDDDTFTLFQISDSVEPIQCGGFFTSQ